MAFSTPVYYVGGFSWSNFDADVPKEVFARALSQRWPPIILLSWLLAMVVIYKLVWIALSKCPGLAGNTFRSLSKERQVIVLHHATEALVGLVLLVPSTYLMVELHFGPKDSLERLEYLALFAAACSVAWPLMYMCELVMRIEKLNWVLVVHHVATMAVTILAFSAPYVGVFRVAITLPYFVNWEWDLFGLVAYRLLPGKKCTEHIIIMGMIVYGVSRIPQAVILTGVFVAFGSAPFTPLWVMVVLAVIVLLLTVVQVWSLCIHAGLYKRARQIRKKLEMGGTSSLTATPSSSPTSSHSKQYSATNLGDSVIVDVPFSAAALKTRMDSRRLASQSYDSPGAGNYYLDLAANVYNTRPGATHCQAVVRAKTDITDMRSVGRA